MHVKKVYYRVLMISHCDIVHTYNVFKKGVFQRKCKKKSKFLFVLQFLFAK